MDLVTGYWQVPLRESNKEKTAFSTLDGLFEFNVLPMGLSNAPGTFQRNMERLLQGLVWTCCLVYIDNIIIFLRTFNEHLRDLAHVFNQLHQGRMCIKAAKCTFFSKELPFLGHLLTRDGIKPDPAKIAVVKDIVVPRTATEVQGFLGLANYYRRFMPAFTQVASPLYRLTGKDVAFKWTLACQEAFKKLRDALVSAPVLSLPIKG
jgi:hypothetical protein